MQRHAKRLAACVSATAAAMLMAATAFADGKAPSRTGGEAIVGAASFYDISGETASGEQYDPKAFTAAAQLAIRDRFGGIKFGSLYQAAYALAEYNGKKLILKINDVGPLRPGRTFDLSRAAMEYFDGMEKGVLPALKVTALPVGRVFEPGPVTDEQLAALGFADDDFSPARAGASDPRATNPEPGAIEPRGGPIDTPSETAVPIDSCVGLTRLCEPGVAIARIEPPAAARDRASEPACIRPRDTRSPGRRPTHDATEGVRLIPQHEPIGLEPRLTIDV